MKFNIGDTVEIKMDAEDSQHELLHMIDGMLAKVTEVYQVTFEPEVDRYEVELFDPVEYEGREVIVIPGLYEDNLEAAKDLTESRVLSAKEFFKR